jgi:hypothetical protein
MFSKLEPPNVKQVGGAVKRRRYRGLRERSSESQSEDESPGPPANLAALFQDPSRPLVVDVGCGAGRFVLLAGLRGVVPRHAPTQQPLCPFSGVPSNVLGLDQHATVSCCSLHPLTCSVAAAHVQRQVRSTALCPYFSQLMARGNMWAQSRGVSGRCHFLATNARESLQATLQSYPGPIALVAVQVCGCVCVWVGVRVWVIGKTGGDVDQRARHF